MVTDALGKTRTYTSSVQHGVSKVTNITAPCSGCGSPFLSRSYDANGFLDKVEDFTGGIVDHGFDARGRETAQAEGLKNPSGSGYTTLRTTQTQWHGDFELPQQRTIARWNNRSNGLITSAIKC